MHIGVAFIPVTFFHFTQTLVSKHGGGLKPIRLGYLIAGGFAVLALLTDLVVPRVSSKLGFEWFMDGGVLYPLLIIYFICYTAAGLWSLARHSLKATNMKQKQLRLLLAGSCVGYMFGLSSFLPVYGLSVPPYPYGNIGIVFYVFLTAYAIFRYGLMDAEFMAKKFIVLVGLFAGVYVAVIGFTFAFERILVDIFVVDKEWMTPILVLSILLVYEPIKKTWSVLTEKYLYRENYQYKQVLKYFIESVMRVNDLEQIIIRTQELVAMTVKPEKFVIYLPNTQEDRLLAMHDSESSEISVSDPLITYLQSTSQLAWTQSEEKTLPRDVAESLRRLEGVLAFPLQIKDRFYGLMLYGPKKNSEIYSEEDLEILSDLAIAETNAIVIARQTGERVSARAAEYLGQLADGLSHQYNNILSAVIRQLEMVSVKLELESAKAGGSATLDDLNTRVKEAVQDADRGTQFAKSVLNHTRPGRVGFAVQDLSSAVEVGVKLVYMKHRDFKTLKLTTDIAKDLPKTWCNITSMQNIFQITVDNAYDAIKMRQEQEPGLEGRIRVAIRHKKLENVIRVEIEDNGVGMKPHILRSVQAQVPHVTTKGSASEKSGFGAGVNFLGKLVAMHQGKLEFISEHMNGTVAVIELPVLDRPADASTVPADQSKER